MRGASRASPSYLSRELGYAEPSPSQPNGHPASKPPGQLLAQDFEFGATLGEGSYSTVKLGTSRIDGKQYAIKIIIKSHLKRAHKVETAVAERKALIRLRGHPGIVSLYHTFHDEWSLYFVLDLASNGEMQSLISRLGSLSTRCVQYYAAQIADAMEYMHSKDVIHRDLKPENLLLDDAFRIKIADFGTGKVLENGAKRATTFVGTVQYQAPELLELTETTASSDYWAFGCVLYQMVAGRFAFNDRSDYLTWQKIKKVEYEFPSGFDEQVKDLVQRLLIRDPLERLGAGPRGSPNDPSALKSHAFFSSIVWTSLWTDPAPPIEPGLVKKEHVITQGQDRNWEDFGAAWDELVGNDDSDGIEWSSDVEGPRQHNGHGNSTPNPHTTDIGPRDGINLPAFLLVKDAASAQLVSNDPSRDDYSSSSQDSPSENAVDTLRGSFEKLEVRSSGRTSPDAPSLRDPAQVETEPGRDRIPTLPTDPPDLFHNRLKLLEGGRIIFDTPKILLQIGGPPVKSKRRHLVLTNRRLFCLKPNKAIKSELVIRPSDKAKDKRKDSQGVISTVELRGEREFALSKTFIYGVLHLLSASSWAEKITNGLAPEEPGSRT
ncbi:kinase-like protein [Mycena vulgaris]|nr:kinase-like protein [Mycena vulgaris]